MKKSLSLALVLILVLTMSVAVFAADNQEASFNLTYKLENADTSNPAETFTFTFTNGQVTDAAAGTVAPSVPDATVSFDAGSATVDGFQKQVSVALGGVTWPSVGIYTYDVTQKAGTTAGVTYSDVTAKLKVTVARDDATGEYYTAFVTLSLADDNNDGQTDVKTVNFENTYSAGSLSVTKNVTGNLGDREKYFAITVTLTGEAGKTYAVSYPVTGGSKLVDGAADAAAATISVGTPATFYLKHGETLTIANLPYGVTYTVTEADYTSEGYDEENIVYSDDANKKIDSATDTVTITNTKGTTVDTGVVLDSLPYVLLIAVAVVGVVAFTAKKRTTDR